jgi:hypothetical protein
VEASTIGLEQLQGGEGKRKPESPDVLFPSLLDDACIESQPAAFYHFKSLSSRALQAEAIMSTVTCRKKLSP